MALEFQIRTWERYTNVAVLNRLMGFQSSSDNWISNDNRSHLKRLHTITKMKENINKYDNNIVCDVSSLNNDQIRRYNLMVFKVHCSYLWGYSLVLNIKTKFKEYVRNIIFQRKTSWILTTSITYGYVFNKQKPLQQLQQIITNYEFNF